jgi:hypothetical protein
MSLDVGTRVRLRRDVDRFPHFLARAGAWGTVTMNHEGMVAVHMDEQIPGAETWDNEIVWYEEQGHDPRRDLEVDGEEWTGHMTVLLTFDDSDLTRDAIDRALNDLAITLGIDLEIHQENLLAEPTP